MSDTLPKIRLKPKADARSLRHGFPWVYADNLVLDRRTRALTPGTVAVLEDAQREPLAQVAFNPTSKIAARLLTRSLAEEIGPEWVRSRVQRALAHREALYQNPFYRLIHAEADGLPGVIVDRFGDTLAIQPKAAWAEAHLDKQGNIKVRL